MNDASKHCQFCLLKTMNPSKCDTCILKYFISDEKEG